MLRCFKRFVSRRGVPGIIVTDNAKTFKAASKWLLAIIKSAQIRLYLNSKRIKWHFNLAKVPWVMVWLVLWTLSPKRQILFEKICRTRQVKLWSAQYHCDWNRSRTKLKTSDLSEWKWSRTTFNAILSHHRPKIFKSTRNTCRKWGRKRFQCNRRRYQKEKHLSEQGFE